ncbi:hypothetical protein AUJ67_05570, partial [Candidatus Desantisbacteria bacterium CG1_02_49_89]
NEKEFIAKCLESIVNQDYPKDKIEVLVVDGMSEDGTRDIVSRYIKQHPYIRLVDNIMRITPSAFNQGIKKSRGEIVIIIGAHSICKEDYIEKCVKYLKEYKTDNIGGMLVAIPADDSFVGKAITKVLSSTFGVGNSIFRTGSKEPRWVDTVFGGCYRREIFEKTGFFNEKLIFSQDMEFNLRLKRAGGKILYHPDIVSYYYARSDFRDFCRHNFRNGIWAIYPIKFSKLMPVSPRHLVPFVFVTALIALSMLSFFSVIFFHLLICMVGLYIAASVYFSAKAAKKDADLKYLFVMPAIFFSLHFVYGLGSIWGLAKLLMPERPLNAKKII